MREMEGGRLVLRGSVISWCLNMTEMDAHIDPLYVHCKSVFCKRQKDDLAIVITHMHLLELNTYRTWKIGWNKWANISRHLWSNSTPHFDLTPSLSLRYISQKQLWAQVPSLPIDFNGTCDHSWLTMLLGNTLLVGCCLALWEEPYLSKPPRTGRCLSA